MLKNNKLAIIACDSAEHPLEEVQGDYDFVLNGFDETLSFHNGIAITHRAINRSTFVFIKHNDSERSIGKLYYISKTDKGLNPIRVHAYLILLIPLLLVLLGMFFRRFLWIAVVLFVVYLYFNFQNGLSIPHFFDTILHEIRDFIRK